MVLSAVIILMVALFGVLNTLVLEQYYFYQKTRMLIGTWDKINRFYQEGHRNIELELEKLSANQSMSLFIADSNFNIVYRSNTRNIVLFRPPNQAEPRPNFPVGNIDGMFQPKDVQPSAWFLSKGYMVERRHDNRLNSDYLQLTGRLNNDSYLFAQIAVESIRESVSISNQFLTIAALITLIIGAGLILAVSRSFTKPILELSSIARKMSQLDFSQRYEGNGDDEFNTLGQSINAMSHQLEQKILELQKTNQKLQLEIDYISQIDETRREFLSNLSHEMKTPLALIQGYAEGLRDNVIQDEENKIFYCEVILDETERTTILVKKLLNLIQMEFGSNELIVCSFDMIQLIQSLLRKHKVLFDSNGIAVEFEQETPLNVWADEYMIEDVLNNYLINAIHHAAGEKRIRIWTELQNSRLRVSVFNTG
jgi:signal transduction histidine kinase